MAGERVPGLAEGVKSKFTESTAAGGDVEILEIEASVDSIWVACMVLG